MSRKSARTASEALAVGMGQAQEVGDCLEWQGHFSNKGTQPTVKVRLDGKNYSDNLSVPRLLWEAEHGPIPEGKWVYRKCCNNACVCLDHLAIGTRKDLMKARKKAGTTKHAPTTRIALTQAARKRANTINSPERARMVREMLAAGERHKVVSERTGVSMAVVADISQGRAWREIGGSPWAGLIPTFGVRA